MVNSVSSARVLIVDDNAVVRSALSGVIRQDERLVLVGEAPSGDAALEMIETTMPDLVCLDVLMQGSDGLTVLRRIREEHPTIRVLMISGQATSEVVKQALQLGAHGFVVKPFNAGKVLNAIHSALDRGAADR